MKINITIPVYNGEKLIVNCIQRLTHFLVDFPYDYEIFIVDNASTDKTAELTKALIKKCKKVTYIYHPYKGKGGAIQVGWNKSKCDVLCFMDVDLSTDLQELLPLVNAVIKQKAVLAIGSRHEVKSKNGRSLLREVSSRSFNFLVKLLFWTPFKDTQCGFKCIQKSYFDTISNRIHDKEFFFDTELLLITYTLQKKIIVIPVHWVNDPNSTVNVFDTACKYIYKLVVLRFTL